MVTIEIEAQTIIGRFASYLVPKIITKVPLIITIEVIKILKAVTKKKLSLQMPVSPIIAKAMAKIPAIAARIM
jgi:hypothetical protein